MRGSTFVSALTAGRCRNPRGYDVQQEAEGLWPFAFKPLCEVGLRHALVIGNSLKGEENAAVTQVAAGNNLSDTGEDAWPDEIEDGFLIVGIQLPGRERTARRQSAYGVREFVAYRRQVVERQDMRRGGGYGEIANITGWPSQRCDGGVDQGLHCGRA